ncbi:gastrotropin-like [Glandiceps talaboti]
MTAIPTEFFGKWELDRHENSEGLFQALGIPESLREKMAGMKNTLAFSEEDGMVVITESTMPGQPDRVQKFRLGVECEIQSLFGTRRAIMTFEDGKLVTRSGNPEEDDLSGIRELIDGQLVVTAKLTKRGVSGSAFYKKVAQ